MGSDGLRIESEKKTFFILPPSMSRVSAVIPYHIVVIYNGVVKFCSRYLLNQLLIRSISIKSNSQSIVH